MRDRVWPWCSASATSRAPAARRSTSTRSPRRSWPGSRARRPGHVPRLGAPRRQALSADLPGDRARGRRPDQGGARLAREPRRPALDDSRRGADQRAFYSFGNERGAGGLPVGASGRVACLLSGGIDSPVAAWRMMRRGCRVLFVHFHSYPILSRASQEKARELARAADALPVPLAALPGAVRRHAAAGRPRRAAAAARRRFTGG